MYFLYKESIYGHGVFWIGEDLTEAKKQADWFAKNDGDEYHSWNVYKYVYSTDIDNDWGGLDIFHSGCEKIYVGRR